MRPPNYRQARNRKEQSRKLRQQEKQERRAGRVRQPGDNAAGTESESPPAAPAAPDEMPGAKS